MARPLSPALPPTRTKRALLTAVTAMAFTIASLALPTPPAQAIVGGEPASREYPHMAAMLVDGYQYCGASLIAPQWVLSAAHCVNTLDPEPYSFLIGGVRDLYGAGGEVIPSTKVIVHPDYDVDHDVVLFQLERPSVYEPIALADPATDRALWEPGDIARVLGYGGQSYQLPSIDGQLREVDVPVVSDTDCDDSYAFTFGGIDESVEVCAGEFHGTKDSCQGDSGGPLMVPDGQGYFKQIGVVSWGFGCGWPTQYGVYSRVGDRVLYDWIQHTIDTTEPPPPPPPPPPSEARTVRVGVGEIVGSSPVGVTRLEVGQTCSSSPVTQGVDGYAWTLPSHLAVDGAIAQVTGESFFHDLDLKFYGHMDGVCTDLGGSGSGDIDERAPIPFGTEIVVAHNYRGADARVYFTVELPKPDTVATTVELSDANATEARFGEEVRLEARLIDETGAGIAGQPMRFALVDAEGEDVQFVAGSPTDADGVSVATMRVSVAAGNYTVRAAFIGEPDRYTEAADAAPFTGLAAETSTALMTSGVGGDKKVTATLTEISSGAGIAVQGRTIEFFAACEFIGSADTLGDGTATISVPARHRGARVEYSAVFAGDPGPEIYYEGSRDGAAC